MKPCPRVRRFAKWIGLALSGVIATLWTASLVWEVERCDIRPGCRLTELHLSSGQAYAAWIIDPKWDWFGPYPHSPSSYLPQAEWSVTRRADVWDARWFVPEWRSPRVQGPPLQSVSVPLSIPLLLLATPTVWLWWRDRRFTRPGLCSLCGYDRAGLATDSVCPECGAAEVGTSA